MATKPQTTKKGGRCPVCDKSTVVGTKCTNCGVHYWEDLLTSGASIEEIVDMFIESGPNNDNDDDEDDPVPQQGDEIGGVQALDDTKRRVLPKWIKDKIPDTGMTGNPFKSRTPNTALKGGFHSPPKGAKLYDRRRFKKYGDE